MELFSSTATITSEKGDLIAIIPYDEKYFTSLIHMYDCYEPLGCVQGLPPRDRDKRHQWAQDVIGTGTNLLALHGDRVIGHASLFSMPANWAEYFIFIHQDFQKNRIGTAITQYVVDWARHENLSAVWVTIERNNFVAVSMCRSAGFTRIASSGSELEMVLTLKQDQYTCGPDQRIG